jgi:hypothetical protein
MRKSQPKPKGGRTLTVPKPADNHERFAIRVSDDHVGDILELGDYAICVRMDEKELADGQLVVVDEHRGDLVQITLRHVVAKPKGGFYLTICGPPSKKLSYPPAHDRAIQIRGLVIGRYRELSGVRF